MGFRRHQSNGKCDLPRRNSMFARNSTMCVALSALMFPVITDVSALEPETHEGIVVKAAEGKLIVSDRDGKNERTLLVAADAKISLDGKDCQLAELHKGYPVKATVEVKGERKVATRIEARKEK
jgi:hypothetical protein